MMQLSKGLKRLVQNSRLNLMVAAGALVLLLVLGPLILRGEGFFSHNRLEPFAVGSMAMFGFKHQGAPAPVVAFDGPDGQMTLARLKGKPVLVNLWASWCVPCVKELPSLERLQASMGGKGFQVVAINIDQSRKDALDFLGAEKIHNLTFYSDPHLLMSIALAEPGIPVSVLYDAQGREVGRLVGGADWSSPEAKALISAAIAPRKEE
jgi:thiol-disulfide isomerase/thioredoxin